MKKLFVLGFVAALLCTGSCMHETKAEHQVQAEKAAPVLTAAEQQKKAQIEKALNGPHGAQIKASVKKYSAIYKVDEKVIHSIILVESGYNKNARSSCGATGMMQLMPQTFKARNVGSNIYDIDQNIHAGTKHYAGLLAKYGGSHAHALSAYNTGGGNVRKGQPIPSYTRGYVNKVMNNMKVMETVTF